MRILVACERCGGTEQVLYEVGPWLGFRVKCPACKGTAAESVEIGVSGQLKGGSRGE